MRATQESQVRTFSPVVELRQYTMVPGRRDDFVRIFDREFVQSQEALGITVIGQFRDLDRPDRYVWLRGFPDMEARRQALTAFYTGPVWDRHKDEANATMTEWHDVLLMRPTIPSAGFRLDKATRPSGDAAGISGLVAATVVPVDAAASQLQHAFDDSLRPAVEAASGRVLATFVTEPAANSYPRLPIRENVSVFAWFAAFPDAEAQAEFAARSRQQRRTLVDVFGSGAEPVVTLRLSPTPRSLLRGV